MACFSRKLGPEVLKNFITPLGFVCKCDVFVSFLQPITHEMKKRNKTETPPTTVKPELDRLRIKAADPNPTPVLNEFPVHFAGFFCLLRDQHRQPAAQAPRCADCFLAPDPPF